MDEIRETALPYLKKCTYEDYAKLPKGAAYQLIGGQLVLTPSPTPFHQLVSGRLYYRMTGFVMENDLGLVLNAPLDVYLNEVETYQPDIIFVPKDRLAIFGEKKIEEAPDLVVEILSSATASHDLKTKFRNYEKYGVREYWVVDPEDKSVEIFVAAGGRLLPDQRITELGVAASRILAGFSVDIEQVFAHPVRRVPGSAKGKIVIADDFDSPLPENALADFES